MVRFFFIAVVGISMIFMLLFGCSETTPQPLAEFDNALEQAYIISVNEDFDLLKASGISVDSVNAVFSLGWNQFIGSMHQNSSTSSHAHVVGFEEPQNIQPRLRGGQDLGTVNINYSGQQVELNRIVTPEGDVFYSNFIKPHGRHGGERGHSGSRGGQPPRGHRGPGREIIEIQYIPNTDYQFETSGSANFNPITITLTSPPALLDITSNQTGDIISLNNDLSLTWSGGSANDKVAIRILPHQFPVQGRHPHPRHFSEGIFILLDTNPGQYTVSAYDLQDLVNNSSTTQIAIMVSQLAVTEVVNDSKMYHAVMRSGDRVILNVE